MDTFQEPQKYIKDPQRPFCCDTQAPPADVFDEFLRLTGGDPAPRGGHADAAKAHAAKVATKEIQREGEHYYGPIGIIPAIYRPKPPEPMPMPTCCSTGEKVKVKDRSTRKR